MNNENIKVTLKIRLSEYLFNIKKFDVNFIIAKVMLDRLYLSLIHICFFHRPKNRMIMILLSD